jgi:DMSO/TMAO reductase YedYZ molybdopterin-dependent catalytic subunit
MSEIIKLCQPTSAARYVVFYGYDLDDEQNFYYEVLRLEDMTDPQTIIAYEMNWQDLPLDHGAPLRLRCETKLGYKMVKYLKQIDFIDNFENLGRGLGGYREDTQYYDWEAAI